jgi:hypothetical protein
LHRRKKGTTEELRRESAQLSSEATQLSLLVCFYPSYGSPWRNSSAHRGRGFFACRGSISSPKYQPAIGWLTLSNALLPTKVHPSISSPTRGSRFTAAIFHNALAGLGSRHRFGAIPQTGSIAIIERFWRTLKENASAKGEAAAPSRRPARTASHWPLLYAHHKPHQRIKGATPAEMYYGKQPARSDAVRPHRAYEKKSDDKLFEIAYLDPQRLLPVLTHKAA